MRKVRKSALVPFAAKQMFALVDDVESYPDFLPWCNAVEIRSRSRAAVEATLELEKGALRKRFTTRNSRAEFSAIDLELLDGPFRHLAGGWTFSDLGDEGCKVSLALEFEFDTAMLDVMFGSFFEATCNSLIDAFTTRAHTIYGQYSR